MLLKQNSCHLDGSSCLLFFIYFPGLLDKGRFKTEGGIHVPGKGNGDSPIYPGPAISDSLRKGISWNLLGCIVPLSSAQTPVLGAAEENRYAQNKIILSLSGGLSKAVNDRFTLVGCTGAYGAQAFSLRRRCPRPQPGADVVCGTQLR